MRRVLLVVLLVSVVWPGCNKGSEDSPGGSPAGEQQVAASAPTPASANVVHRFENLGVSVNSPPDWRQEKFFDNWKLTWEQPGKELFLAMIGAPLLSPGSLAEATKTCGLSGNGRAVGQEELGPGNYLVRCEYDPPEPGGAPRRAVEVFLAKPGQTVRCEGSHESDVTPIEQVCRSLRWL